LDEGAELPTDRLELFFLLKAAVKHTVLIAHQTVASKDGIRDSTLILARCARRLAVVAQALADANPMTIDEMKTLNRKEAHR
jgi:hypothetical protein